MCNKGESEVDKGEQACGGGSRAAGHPFWEQLANDVGNVHTIFSQSDSVMSYVYMRLKGMERVWGYGTRNMTLNHDDGIQEKKIFRHTVASTMSHLFQKSLVTG